MVDQFAVACRRLGLRPRERTLVREAAYAWTLVSNGHLLISPGRIAAARRLIARGYLVEADEQPATLGRADDFGLVVVLKQAGLDRLIADANMVAEVVWASRPGFPLMVDGGSDG